MTLGFEAVNRPMGDAIPRFQSPKFSCLLIVVLLFLLGLSTGAWSQISVTTFHNDNSRTGQNTQETVLTPANVNSAQFGKLFTISVDGHVFAQPLYLAAVQNIAGGTHRVLYIATQHGSLFAIDADTGAILWQKSFINPAAGINTVSPSDVSCTDITPESSITSTPVIDPSSGTIYLLVKTNENGQFFQRLHAIDVAAGAEKFGGPVAIAATVNGSGDHGETVTFNPLTQHNRPGLLLQNGHIVMGWASYCDNPPYHGWVMSYRASTLAQEAVLNLSPNGTFAGVWMSGDGIAADANENYYLASGNGSYSGPASGNYGDSILQLGPASSGTLPVLDFFTPWNQNSLSGEDSDVGSAGVLLLPDLPAGSTHQHLLVQMGKEGTIYLIDRDNMGGYCSTCIDTDTQIVQEINNASIGVWGSPAYWNGSVYWASNSNGTTSNMPSNLMAFSFNANNSGLLSTAPTSQSNNTFNFGTGTPVVSANGNNDGIVWLLDNSTFHATCCQVLYAFDATNLANMLYNSSQAAAKRDVPGAAVKFSAPLVANGKVYVGSQFQVSAYGLISPTATTVTSNANPAYLTQNVTYTAAVTAITQSATPNGSATFYQGTTALGTVPLTDGQASYSTTYSTAGAFRITAIFTGTPGTNFVTSTSPLLQQVIHALPATTTTKLTSSAPSIFVGQTVTLTATVSSTFGTPPNDEIVTFKSGGVAIGTGTLSGGAAKFTTSTLVAANHVLLASYAGDADFAASQSATITLPVSKYSTTIALTSTPNPSSLSQAVTLTARVTSGSSTLTGSITFRNGTTILGIATLSGGIATLATKTLPLGPSQLTATYSGDAANLTSTSPSLTQTVTQAASTTTALISTLNPAYVTQTVTYSATVTAQSGTPTGSVTFTQGSTALATVPLSGGQASYSTTYSASGAYLITAAYSPAPGANFASSTSPALKETVHPLPAASTTKLTSSAASIYVGQTVTLTATVSSPFGTPPNGEIVTFKSGGVAIGTGTLSSGVATFTTSTLVAASHVLLATYPGDSNFAINQSATVTLPVNKYPTATALSSTPSPSSSGQAVTLTAQVTTTGPSTPTGSVAFLNGTTTLGTVRLNGSGIAILTTKLLPVGANQLTAKYNGGAMGFTSVSPPITQTVN
jgi:Big-like domain-containing protein/PQQ enzyme-like repeat protein